MRSRLTICGWALLIVLGLVPPADARTVVLKEPALLRRGASKTTRLLGELPTGTQLEVVGESGGWIEVVGADDQHGWIWAERATDIEGATTTVTLPSSQPAPAATAPVGAPVPSVAAPPPPPSPPPAEATRAAPAAGDDLEKLRAEIARLGDQQRDLVRRLEEQDGFPDPGPETAWVAWAYLGVGAIIGWILGMIASRRRSRRQHQRIRID